MADVYTRIGYIKGATGAQGERGLQGDPGDAATIQVGTVTTVPYGQTANVVNSGTESAAVFDFTIPQGRPGQETTDMQNLTLGSITTSSASFPVPAVGETGKVLWGKVVKWFSDMAALVASKFDAANVVNNLTTTASGYALDARQGKALNDFMSIDTENVVLSNKNANAVLYRTGHVCTLVSLEDFQSVDSGTNQIGTIPVGYRPNTNYRFPIVNKTSSANQWVNITSSGVIQLYSSTASSGASNGAFVCTWITNR